MAGKRLYVLELENGKYYVGTTYNLQRRFQEHVDGEGSVWTQKYAPVAIERSVPVDGPLHEDRVTKELMLKYGIDNVRGGSYCSIDLDDGKYQSLTTELRSATGVCFKCGLTGHFAAQCHVNNASKNVVTDTPKPKSKATSKKDDGCFRCGRSGHWADTCYARTSVDGSLLCDSSESDESEYDEYDSD